MCCCCACAPKRNQLFGVGSTGLFSLPVLNSMNFLEIPGSMAEIYLLPPRKIERARYDLFHIRHRVARPRRALIAFDIWSRALLEPRPRDKR